MNSRKVIEQTAARPASDGDGVKLERVFGGAQPERYDPFLLLDEFGSDKADDYIGGFPSHPHRGFSTITYMLQGKMEHRDHMGNVGLLNDGDVQWMTAGKGIIHSEMPQQTQGKMHGFQLWLNLPASEKMQTANYQDVPAEKIPHYRLNGLALKAIAGKAVVNDTAVEGYFQVAHTNPLYLDIHLEPNAEARISSHDHQTALVYTYTGEIVLGDQRKLATQGILSRLDNNGDVLMKNPGNHTSRVLLLAGTPLNESIVQHGPFVMNTQEEIAQTLQDYREGVLTAD